MIPSFSTILRQRWLNDALLAAFMGIFVFSTPAWGQDPQPSELQTADTDAGKQLEAEAWAAYDADNLEQSDELFRAAIAADRWQAWRGCAEVARKNDDQQSAIAAFQQLLKHAPDAHDARLDLAHMLSWSGQHQAAQPHFEYLLQHAQDDDIQLAARQGLADLAAWSGNHQLAYAQYQQELEQTPNSVSALKGMGELELWKSRPDHAADYFRDALALDPGNDSLSTYLQQAQNHSRPQAIFQAQYFQDTANWKRTKVMTGVEMSPAPIEYKDWRIFVGTEYSTFEQPDGLTVSRKSILTRQTLHPTTFSTLNLDLESGEAKDESSLRGGVRMQWDIEDEVVGWVSWRHDDFIDPIGPTPFDRYNSAATVNLLHGDILQADTFRAGFFNLPEQGNGFLVDVLGGPIEDGNDRLETYIQLHRRIQHQHGWDGVGRLFYHHSNYNFDSPSYFSPSNLDSWGFGWRGEWERDIWSAYTDLSGFWQSGIVDSWGYQYAAGWEREWSLDLRTGIHANYLSTDERGMDARYGAFALMLLATLDF